MDVLTFLNQPFVTTTIMGGLAVISVVLALGTKKSSDMDKKVDLSICELKHRETQETVRKIEHRLDFQEVSTVAIKGALVFIVSRLGGNPSDLGL